MMGCGVGLFTGQEGGTYLCARCSQGEDRRHAAPIRNTARCDDGRTDRIHHLGHQGQGAHEGRLG